MTIFTINIWLQSVQPSQVSTVEPPALTATFYRPGGQKKSIN